MLTRRKHKRVSIFAMRLNKKTFSSAIRSCLEFYSGVI